MNITRRLPILVMAMLLRVVQSVDVFVDGFGEASICLPTSITG